MAMLLASVILVGCVHRPVPSAPETSATLAEAPVQARIHYVRAQRAITLGALDQAEEELLLAHLFDPLEPRVALWRGRVAEARGDWTGARDAYLLATGWEPVVPEAWLRLGHAEMALGHADEAIDAFAHAVDAGAGFEARAAWIDQLVQAGRTHEAQDVLAAWKEPTSATEWWARGERSYALHDLRSAEIDLERALVLQPADAASADRYLACVEATGHWGRALETFDRLAEDGLATDPVAWGLYEVALQLGDPVRAERAIGVLVGRHPGDPDVLLARARVHLLRGETAAAIATARPLVAARPEARWVVGEALAVAGDLAGARATLDMGTPPRELVVLIAERLVAAQQDADAFQSLESLVGLGPAERIRLRAHLLLSMGRAPDALALLEDGTVQHPSDADLVFAWCDALAASGRSREVGPVLDQALRRMPGDARIQTALADALVAEGRPAEATPLLHAVLSQVPEDPDANFLLAELTKGTDPLTAEVQLRQALAHRPLEPRYLLALGELLLETGRPREAAEVLAEAERFDPENPRLQKLHTEAERRAK